MKEYKTEDYESGTIPVSTLDEKGIDFVFKSFSTGHKGVFGEYSLINGFKDGDDISLSFYSEKLLAIFMENSKEMVGKKINLSGRGEGNKRNYSVKLA